MAMDASLLLMLAGVWQGALAAFTTFAVIAAAEIGDKSQLVCMTLAARHRPWPVVLGATTAFALLNALAVVFGASVARWIPQYAVGLGVFVLFLAFGLHALRAEDEEEGGLTALHEPRGRHGFRLAFLMIFAAEFGDKTQIITAGLSTSAPPLYVWLGATLALAATSTAGVFAGRLLMRRVSPVMIHRAGGVLFLLLAFYALYETWTGQRGPLLDAAMAGIAALQEALEALQGWLQTLREAAGP